MKGKLFALVVVVALVLSACGSSGKVSPAVGKLPSSSASGKTFTGSLKSLLTDGTSRTCTVSTNLGTEGTATAKIYSNGSGELRYTITGTNVAGTSGATDINLIIKSGKAYEWSAINGRMEGFVMPSDKIESSAEAESIALDQDRALHCSSGSLDTSQFNLPSGVNFTDISNIGADLGTTPTT